MKAAGPAMPVQHRRELLALEAAPGRHPAMDAALRGVPVPWPGMGSCHPVKGRGERVLGVLILMHGEGAGEGEGEGPLATALELAGMAIDSQRSDDLIRRLAQCDELTGLSNRSSMVEALDRALARARRGEGHVGILLLELDHFRVVNERHGPEAGDAVLREIAARLPELVRKGDLVGRWGGDEFLVMVEQFDDARALARVAGKLLAAVATPVEAAGLELGITGSIGIATCPEDGVERAALLRHAGLALQRAKEGGRNNFRFHSRKVADGTTRQMALRADLASAVQEGQFVLHYQPRLDVQGGSASAVEALLRWQHPREGLLWPARFLALAEDSGLLQDIGRASLRQACLQMRQWQGAGLVALRLVVNLSPTQLSSHSLVSDVAQALQESGLAPGMLELEFTEAALSGSQASQLRALRDLGVRLAIDDFGSGPASANALHDAGVDAVTIPRNLIREWRGSGKAKPLAPALLSLARALQLRVTAKGVESRAEFDRVAGAACDEVQGYGFSRPLPPGELLSFLQRYQARPVAAAADPGVTTGRGRETGPSSMAAPR